MNDSDLTYYTRQVRRQAFEEAAALILTMHTTSLRAIAERVLTLRARAEGEPKASGERS